MAPRLPSIAALLLLCSAGVLAAAERPPQRLQLVGDHWTAWDPPTSFPEGAEIYTIVRGDTLWDLAARFYGDPYLWPQLWERNQYILDAHWIYPGDPLVVGFEVTPIEEIAEEGIAEEEMVAEEEADRILAAPSRPPVPLGSESDIYCSGYIGDLDDEFGFRIIGSEYEGLSPTLGRRGAGRIEGIYGKVDTIKVGLSSGDIVYVDGGLAGGLTPGSVFTIVWPEEEVRHPVDGRVVGRFYRYLGRLRILSAQEDSGIAEVIESCNPVRVGAALKPFEPEPVPLARRTAMRPVNEPASSESLEPGPAIIFSDANLVSLGQDHTVFIDRGAEDGVSPGDVFTIYRLNASGLPPVVLGELAVLSVRDSSALAKILESRYTIYLGDRLEPK